MELTFATAYRQLRPTEKAFVDGYVSDLETAAVRTREPLETLLHRPSLQPTDEHSTGFLARPLVRAAIAERVRELSEQMELSIHRVVKELSGIAFSSIGHYMEIGQDGQPYFDMTKCTPEQLAAIASIEIEDNPRGARKFKFKLHDKMSALDKFMRMVGLLEADNPYAAQMNKARTPVEYRALPANANDDQAAEEYARLING